MSMGVESSEIRCVCVCVCDWGLCCGCGAYEGMH